ncbi:MAG: GNAT family N-acetyltransferase [Microbacterium sp.]
MLSFRAVSPAEPSAHALLEEYFAMRAEAFPGQYRTAMPSPEIFVAPAGVLLVGSDAERGDITIGGIRRVPDGPHGARYEVKHLFTRPAARGMGAGRAILRELERRAREWGAQELVLDTHHTLAAAAALYAVEGFTAIDRYNENPNATRWYGKAL